MANHVGISKFVAGGLVTVESMTGTPYSEILTSMGSIVYRIGRMYLHTSDVEQISKSLTFNKYDVNGNIQQKNYLPALDPYQDQTALFVEFDRDQYVLNGQLAIDFNIDSAKTVLLYLYTQKFSADQYLKELDEFPTDFLKTYDFFKEFKDTIE